MLLPLAALEAIAGAAVAVRLVRTAGGRPLRPGTIPHGTLGAIVPVLNESARLGPALDALRGCGELAQIVVVDGGSTDGTAALVLEAAQADPRLRLVHAGDPPPGWNGKAWNLAVGLRAVATPWIATIDADVCVAPGTLAAAVARAEKHGLVALSVATRQRLAGPAVALLHPALLTTLVYRAGIPNHATRRVAAVQANGQCFVARRDALAEAGAVELARASRCEDVTIARALAARGGAVGFYEGDATVRMHDGLRDCAASWPRSLPLHDRFTSPVRTATSLALVALAQALPLPTLLAALATGERAAAALAGVLVAQRLGVLAGTRRAYVRPPLAYWLSPLADLPAVVLIVASALRRRHRWRGRILVDEAAA